jgi:hypothetical protein
MTARLDVSHDLSAEPCVLRGVVDVVELPAERSLERLRIVRVFEGKK